jgi:hypothetical protein
VFLFEAPMLTGTVVEPDEDAPEAPEKPEPEEPATAAKAASHHR